MDGFLSDGSDLSKGEFFEKESKSKVQSRRKIKKHGEGIRKKNGMSNAKKRVRREEEKEKEMNPTSSTRLSIQRQNLRRGRSENIWNPNPILMEIAIVSMSAKQSESRKRRSQSSNPREKNLSWEGGRRPPSKQSTFCRWHKGKTSREEGGMGYVVIDIHEEKIDYTYKSHSVIFTILCSGKGRREELLRVRQKLNATRGRRKTSSTMTYSRCIFDVLSFCLAWLFSTIFCNIS